MTVQELRAKHPKVFKEVFEFGYTRGLLDSSSGLADKNGVTAKSVLATIPAQAATMPQSCDEQEEKALLAYAAERAKTLACESAPGTPQDDSSSTPTPKPRTQASEEEELLSYAAELAKRL